MLTKYKNILLPYIFFDIKKVGALDWIFTAPLDSSKLCFTWKTYVNGRMIIQFSSIVVIYVLRYKDICQRCGSCY